MHPIPRLVLVVAMLMASPSLLAGGVDPRLESLAWLLGHWQRTGLPEGRVGHEHWQVGEGAYTGVGMLQRDGQTVFQETLRIQIDGEDVVYVADVSGNAAPVLFRLVEQSPGSVAFENPEHDFPQRIAYRREGDRLHATISGNGREVSFAFQRQAQ